MVTTEEVGLPLEKAVTEEITAPKQKKEKERDRQTSASNSGRGKG
jgi:hypothetical protein